MKYLRDEQFYYDLYDLGTIKKCLWKIDFWRREYQKKDKHADSSIEDRKKAFYIGQNLDLYYTKGERSRSRMQRIKEMIQSDQQKQEFYDTTPEPENIRCYTCGRQLRSDMKLLEDYEGKPMKVLFYFPCTICKKKRAVYNDGKEHIFEPELCPKCRSELDISYKKEKDKRITTIRKCKRCSFIEKETDDYEERHKKWEEEKEADRQLLQKYRSEFCLSEEESRKYVDYVDRFMSTMSMIQKNDEKKADPVYQAAMQLKKIGVVELEKMLSKALEKEKYIKLFFDKPEMGRQVIIPFTVQDSDNTRDSKNSEYQLKKLLKKTLKGTNWKLMTEGVFYRVGYVSGRLKGYEGEDDLMEMVNSK